MTIPNTNWGEITTTTLFNRSKKLADNVSKNNALLRRLSAKGKVKPVDGGQAIVQELEYSENGTFKRYSGFSLVPLAA
jgi:hypothetical protein